MVTTVLLKFQQTLTQVQQLVQTVLESGKSAAERASPRFWPAVTTIFLATRPTRTICSAAATVVASDPAGMARSCNVKPSAEPRDSFT